MTDIRILTVRQPWAGAIIHQGKDVENRVRNIAGSYRGTVAIHAALRHDYSAVDALIECTGYVGEHNIYGYGTIIGVVDLVGVHHAGDCYAASIGRAADLYRTDRTAFDALPATNGSGGLLGRADYCSPWADPADYHLELANPHPLTEPIPYRGALGLRRLPEDVADQVFQRIGRTA